MHPFKSQAESDHKTKLRTMTDHYGSANPAANKSGPTNIFKQEGPEDNVGFGADSTKAKARSDRPARKAVPNDVATLKTGGAVNRARGGRTHKKGATNVTVVVAPPHPAQSAAGNNPAIMPPPHPPAGGPPMPPPGGPGAGPGGPPPVLPPGMPPPGMMPPRAAGGRVGSLKDQGLNPPSTVKEEPGITTKKGKVTGYDAGGISGEGRLEKIKNYGRKESHAKPQEV